MIDRRWINPHQSGWNPGRAGGGRDLSRSFRELDTADWAPSRRRRRRRWPPIGAALHRGFPPRSGGRSAGAAGAISRRIRRRCGTTASCGFVPVSMRRHPAHRLTSVSISPFRRLINLFQLNYEFDWEFVNAID